MPPGRLLRRRCTSAASASTRTGTLALVEDLPDNKDRTNLTDAAGYIAKLEREVKNGSCCTTGLASCPWNQN